MSEIQPMTASEAAEETAAIVAELKQAAASAGTRQTIPTAERAVTRESLALEAILKQAVIASRAFVLSDDRMLRIALDTIALAAREGLSGVAQSRSRIEV